MRLTAVLIAMEPNGFHAFNPETGATATAETVDEAVGRLREATIRRLKERPRSGIRTAQVEVFEIPPSAGEPNGETPRYTLLTHAQKTALARMLYRVFLMLRAPRYNYFWEGKASETDLAQVSAALRRSVAFAEALHNFPGVLSSGECDFDFHLMQARGFLKACPDLEFVVDELTRIRSMPAYGDAED